MKLGLKNKIVFFMSLAILIVPVYVSAKIVPCDVNCGFNDFILLIQNVINFLMFDIAAPLAAVVFAWAGIIMFTSGGSADRIKQSKEIFQYVVIGIFIALAGWLIVSTIMGTLLGGSISGFIQQNFLSF